MATKKDTTKCKTTKESKPKKSSKRSKTKPTCNNVTTYQTINVDELAHNNKTIETDKDTTIKEEVNVDNQNEKPIDMLIIHENRKPWSLPFTISVAIASVLILLAMITGFPTIMYTILSATAG